MDKFIVGDRTMNVFFGKNLGKNYEVKDNLWNSFIKTVSEIW